VREWGDEIVFLHRILPGRTDRSYGIQKSVDLDSLSPLQAFDLLRELRDEVDGSGE
jgi:DNA mismatch repair ATPase MutS